MRLALPERSVTPPPAKVHLEDLEQSDALALVTQEYAALRGEIQTALGSQAAILSFGAAAAGLLVVAGAELWVHERVAAGLLHLIGVPAMCLLAVVLFLGEQIRLTRAGYHLHTVEVWINAAAPGGASILGGSTGSASGGAAATWSAARAGS